jgi:hypothetical protein
MKLKMDDVVDVNVHHDHAFDKHDVAELIDKVTESALVIIAASTVAYVVKKHL